MTDRFVLMLRLVLVLSQQLPTFAHCQICGVKVDGRRVCERCYWAGALAEKGRV